MYSIVEICYEKGEKNILENPTAMQHCTLHYNEFLLPLFNVVITGGDIGRLKDKRGIGSGDSYRVLLVDDVRHTEKLGNFLFLHIHDIDIYNSTRLFLLQDFMYSLVWGLNFLWHSPALFMKEGGAAIIRRTKEGCNFDN